MIQKPVCSNPVYVFAISTFGVSIWMMLPPCGQRGSGTCGTAAWGGGAAAGAGVGTAGDAAAGTGFGTVGADGCGGAAAFFFMADISPFFLNDIMISRQWSSVLLAVALESESDDSIRLPGFAGADA